MNQELKTFNPLNVSSKFAICGLPIRVDTYKNCGFGCSYCFANNRVVCEFDKTLQVANL
jgi:DNA repair photolyase